jgi:hypothetical protein
MGLLRRVQRGVQWRLWSPWLRAVEQVAARTYDPHQYPDETLLWVKGIARLCDFSGPPGYWIDATEAIQAPEVIGDAYAGAAGLVWVRLGTGVRDGKLVDLDAFATHALPRIERPFVLLTTDGDTTVPSEVRPETVARILASPWLRGWFTQNCDAMDHPMIRPFPIGLDLHKPRPFGSPRKTAEELRRLAFSAKPAAERPLSVYSDVTVSVASPDRHAAWKLLPGVPHIRSQRLRVTQRTTWRRYAQSRFVLSLKGNGYDCHRTWEALYLGAIVIALRSELDPLYEGLPVVLIDSLEELLDARNLEKWSEQALPLADRDAVWQRLDAHRWIEPLRQRVPAGGQRGASGHPDFDVGP